MRSRGSRADYPSFSGPSYGQMGCAPPQPGRDASDFGSSAAAAAAAMSSSRPFLPGSPSTTTTPGGRANGGGGDIKSSGRGAVDYSSGVADEADGPDGRRGRRRRREHFLCCCCCALALGLLAVSGFLLLSYLPAFRPPRSDCAAAGHGGGSRVGGGSSDRTYCLSRACLKTAAEMEEMLNQTVQPCGSFFDFACQGWLADNHMPPTEAAWSRAAKLQAATDAHLRETLETSHSNDGGGGGWEAKLRSFYEACVSVEDPRLAQCDSRSGGGGGGGIGGPGAGDEFQGLLNACQGRRRLTDRILCLQTVLGVDSLFRMQPVQSPWSAGDQILLLDEHSDWQLGDIADTRERQALRGLVADLVDDLEHLGDSVGKNYADSVLTVLMSLDKISLPRSHPLKDQPLLRAQRFTVAEFRRQLKNAGSLIQFDKLIAHFLHRNADADVDPLTVAVGNPSYFYRLGNLLKGLRDDDLKKYLEFCIILKYAPFYSAKSRRDLLRHAARLNGQEHAAEDWQPCLRLLRSPGLSAFFYREMRDRLQLHLVSGIIVPLLKEAFVDLVQSSGSLGPLAKELILKKLRYMKIVVGYSKDHLQQAYLDEYFRDWNDTSNQSLLQMVKEWTRFQQSKERTRLLINQHRIEESMDITSVYPSYYVPENTVFLPAAFFQWPFHLWDNTMPYYLKFANIGSAIATEMARGFDTVGSRWVPTDSGLLMAGESRPGVGEPLLLLSPETEACLSSQLVLETSSTPNSSPTSRAAIVRAAFAAAWGLRVAAGAHRLYLMRRSERQLGLPTLSYSPVEFFYISFAQANCGLERPEMRSRLASSYLPLRTKVQLAVHGSSQFGEAFQCGDATSRSSCLLSNSAP